MKVWRKPVVVPCFFFGSSTPLSMCGPNRSCKTFLVWKKLAAADSDSASGPCPAPGRSEPLCLLAGSAWVLACNRNRANRRRDKENEAQKEGWQWLLADVGQWNISALLSTPRGDKAFQRKERVRRNSTLWFIPLLFLQSECSLLEPSVDLHHSVSKFSHQFVYKTGSQPIIQFSKPVIRTREKCVRMMNHFLLKEWNVRAATLN